MSRVVAIVAAALLLAVGMGALGVITANALRERDRAVQDGVLLSVAQQVESDLRQAGPEGADAYFERLLRERADAVAGAEISVPTGVIVRAGLLERTPTLSSMALGPAWRQFAMPSEMRGGGRGYPPFTLRLYPAAALGHHGWIATAVIAGSWAAAAALFVLALIAARGLLERERRITAEAEQKRLHLAAVAGAGLAHRIRTPLATIKGTAQVMLTSPSTERAQRIVRESERIDDMIRRLLEFARPPEPQRERFDVVPVVREAAARFEPVEVLTPDAMFVFADPVHFDTTLEELFTNARAFFAGRIEVLVRPASGDVLIEVRDHGAGLAVDPLQAFEPYVTTRTDGTGLGLSIAQALMRSNGGDLSLRNADGGGCLATIRLPEAR